MAGCFAPEPEYILQTRVLEREVTRPPVIQEVTRVVREIVTATPPPPIPTPLPPPTMRLYLPPQLDGREGQFSERLAQWLGAQSGLPITATTPSTYRETLTALCTGQAEVAWLSVPAYLVAYAQCGVQAQWSVVLAERGPLVAQIMIQSEEARKGRDLKPIRSLEDLNGKTLAYTDPRSIAGYLLPKALLAEAGVKPAEEIFVGGDAQAVLAVYKGEVDAAVAVWGPLRADGMGGDARNAVFATHPDVYQVVRVLRLLSPIPNDPIVLRQGLPQDVHEKLVVAFVALGQSQEGRELLQTLGPTVSLAPAYDADYAELERAGRMLQYDFISILEGGYPVLRR